MTPGELLIELFGRGVRVDADGDRLRFSPRSKVTPELVELLRIHKAPLLKKLGRVMFTAKPQQITEAPVDTGPMSEARHDVWLEGDEVDIAPCLGCGSLELWESARWPHAWRCMQCDPLTASLRLLGISAHRQPIPTAKKTAMPNSASPQRRLTHARATG